MKISTVTLLAGVLALLGGLVALVFPLPVGLGVVAFTGAAFLIAGAMGLFGAFRDANLPNRIWVAAFSLMELVLGVVLLADPLSGLVTLTLAVATLFLLSGIARLVIAYRMRGTGTFWLLLLTGLLSTGLGLYVFFNPLEASAVLLGTLLAVELISAGAALIAIWSALRKQQ